jgi:hypothetical protein
MARRVALRVRDAHQTNCPRFRRPGNVGGDLGQLHQVANVVDLVDLLFDERNPFGGLDMNPNTSRSASRRSIGSPATHKGNGTFVQIGRMSGFTIVAMLAGVREQSSRAFTCAVAGFSGSDASCQSTVSISSTVGTAVTETSEPDTSGSGWVCGLRLGLVPGILFSEKF